MHIAPRLRKGSDSCKTSHNSLRQEEQEVRGRIRKEDRRKGTDNTVFANATSTVNNAFAPRKSKGNNVRFSDFASHTSSYVTDLGSVQSSVDILLHHKLPKARQRTDIVTQNYTPRGRLFGGYTTRGEGVTMASYRFPEVISAIHSICRHSTPLSRDRCSNTPVALHFLWYRRLSLLHPPCFP